MQCLFALESQTKIKGPLRIESNRLAHCHYSQRCILEKLGHRTQEWNGVCAVQWKKKLNGNVHVQQDWARSRHMFKSNISQRPSELCRVQLVSLQLTNSLHLEIYFRKASGHAEKVVALHKFRKDKVYCRSWRGRYQPRALTADRLRPHMHTVVWVTGRDTLGNRFTTNINKIYSGTL